MNKQERQTDLLRIIEQIDISPTMYRNAVQKYHNLVRYLEEHELTADFYPQGSFALGTVTRPYSMNEDRNYDLDFICQVQSTREDIGPKELRDQIQKVLEDGDLYGGKLTVYDECFTIEYADVGSIGFSIDIVPAVDETCTNKLRLRAKCDRPDLIDTAIAIPRNSQGMTYNWITNNPKGYKKWFMEINAPFEHFIQDDYKYNLFRDNRTLFNSVEEVPDELTRSAMQRVVQILKYHRDVFYYKVNDGDELKPISAIINTIVARISSTASPSLAVFDLLNYVVAEFSIYSNLLSSTETAFEQKYGERNVINKSNGKWIIPNPANPEDNLANQWNDDKRIPVYFFKWVEALKNQLIDSFSMTDEDFRANVEAAFGRNIVQKAWNLKYNAAAPQIVTSSTLAKPWR